jgi:hemerythrin
MLKWSSEYLVNHPEIDQEHQSLFELLNRFYQGLSDGSPKEKLANLIKGLIDYAKIHFSNEEAYMQSINFPKLDAHRKEHEAFLKKASEFYEKYKDGKLILSLEVTNFIKTWISHHIMTEDRQYAEFAGL